MGHLELAHVDYFLDDGRQLLRDVNLRLGEGERCALIGSNGVGKTTLLRILAGELEPHDGSRSTSGTFGYMRQLVGQVRDSTTIESLLLATSTAPIVRASANLRRREKHMLERDDEQSQMAYAQAVVDWGDAGGYEEEVRWDAATVRALGEPFDRVGHRAASTLSGGQQKRLVLEALATGPHDVLILDEPDNYLDVAGKAWLEALIRDTPKSILFVTHDREVIARAASSIATLERSAAGASVWLHGSGYADYAAKRAARNARIDELRRRWFEDEQQLKDLVLMYRQKAKYNSDMAKRYQAAQSRLERFRAEGAPEAPPVDEDLDMRLSGGRTAKRAVVMSDLEMPGLLNPLTTEIWFGDRIAVVGKNGTGKSHFLRVIAREAADDEPRELVETRRNQIPSVTHQGRVSLGSRVRPGYFVQTHDRDDLAGRTLLDILSRGDSGREGLDRGRASSALNRYGLISSAQSRWDDLSGGQRARFQILLLELGGATLLLLDEPTDNLDVESAEALEHALARFAGTVVAVTHDRWFARSFERFLALGDDGSMVESTAPMW